MGDVKDFATDIVRGEGVGFERIRRITGYLSGSLESWGGAKQAEERDRVKHTDIERQSVAV